MKKEKIIIHNKCFAVGFELLNGPQMIFPPSEEDEFGWMESDLKIILTPHDHKKIESISIFVDDTMNREESFLDPIIRHCTWFKDKDQSGDNDWPTIQLQYSYIEDKEIVHQKIKQLQKTVQKIEFKELGLSIRRDVVEVTVDYEKPMFELYSRNGYQAITIHGYALKDDKHTEIIFDLFRYLKKIIKPFNQKGWKERYAHNLKNNLPLKRWDMRL